MSVASCCTHEADLEREIALRKEAEKQLQLANTILQNAGSVIVMFDQQLELVYASPALYSILGYQTAELLGQEWYRQTYFDQKEAENGRNFGRTTLTNGFSPSPLRRRMRCKDGSDRVLLWQAARTDDNKIIAIGHDVTHLEITQQQLQESESRFRGLSEALPQAVLIYDRETFQIMEVNPQAELLYGYTRDEFLELHLEATLADRKDFERLQRALADELDVSTWQHKTRFGHVFSVAVKRAPVSFRGRNAMIASITDVTEQLKIEAQLRQSTKMEAIGMLAGGVAHDFNNILGVIIGHAELLLGASTADPQRFIESTRRRAEAIYKATQRASALTSQLLSFGRKQVLEPVIISVNEIVRETENLLHRTLREDIKLETTLSSDLWTVKADPAQLQSVILNLAVNARDAMPKGGELNISTQNIVLDDEYIRLHENMAPGGYVLLTVTDSGTGMDEHTKTHLFEPFFTTKPQGQGTGLGLSSVYGIVHQSGGSITVYSELGSGSTFKIYLPRAAGEAAPAMKTDSAAPKCKGGTVLFAEDQADVRELVKEVLTSAGFEVLTATDGPNALTLAANSKKIDLLITDVIMPGMNGSDLTLKLRQNRPDLKVLYVSGYTADALTRLGVEEDSAFLSKPFSPRTLLEKMNQMLSK